MQAFHIGKRGEKCLFKARIFMLVFAVAIVIVAAFILLMFRYRITSKYLRENDVREMH